MPKYDQTELRPSAILCLLAYAQYENETSQLPILCIQRTKEFGMITVKKMPPTGMHYTVCY